MRALPLLKQVFTSQLRLRCIFAGLSGQVCVSACLVIAFSLIAPVCGVAADSVKSDVVNPQAIDFFENRIRPVLVKQCYQCHSKANRSSKGGLLVDTRRGLLVGGESGPAVVPGDVKQSLLLDAIRHDSLEMPPDGQLPERVIADFETWIKAGAIDPRDDTQTLPDKDEDASQFWAFRKPQRSELPKVLSRDWPITTIDHYVLARMEADGRRPVRDANRNSLLRRIYFDLVGLPPTVEQLEAFLNDPAPTTQALESVVDELLDSRHFGERWGRHWLDVARYAESTGMEWNWAHPMAWRYRDYVIRSWNQDKPYDQFLREQIAGDLLPADGNQQRDEQLMATGFLAIGPKAVSIGNDEEFGLELADEQINTVSRAFLGLTVGCARCHDHKSDPIPTDDYYALAGIFLSTQTLFGTSASGFKGRNNKQGTPLVPIGVDAIQKEEAWRSYENQLAEKNKKLSDLKAELESLMDDQDGGGSDLSEADPGRIDEKESITSSESESVKEPAEETASRIASLEAEIEDQQRLVSALEEKPPVRPDYTMGVRDRDEPIDCELRIGGEIDQRGEAVPRGFLSAVRLEETFDLDRQTSGRFALANWLTHPDHPLTARVMVNRIWYHLFGRGLVATVDNFGWLGKRPSHPMLLDHLALKFVEDGWSVKSMIRRMVLSRTYRLSTVFDAQQASEDPGNLTMWRMRPRRLNAEAIRDAILTISGRLKRQPLEGSPAVEKLDSGWIGNEVAEPEFKNYTHDHRSVYLPIVRDQIPEILQTFDFPNSTEVTGQRESSMVPAQALYLMNSEFVVASSQLAAERLLASTERSDWEKLEQLYRSVLSRSPTPRELERDKIALEEIKELFVADGQSGVEAEQTAWATLFQSLFSSGEFLILF